MALPVRKFWQPAVVFNSTTLTRLLCPVAYPIAPTLSTSSLGYPVDELPSVCELAVADLYSRATSHASGRPSTKSVHDNSTCRSSKSIVPTDWAPEDVRRPSADCTDCEWRPSALLPRLMRKGQRCRSFRQDYAQYLLGSFMAQLPGDGAWARYLMKR